MAIAFYTGKPGGGKTYKAVAMIVEELRKTNRSIVTNVALNLPELAQYLHDNYGETFNMRERIRILNEEELSHFWHFFGPHSDQVITGKKEVKHLATAKERIVLRDDFDVRNGHPAVFYVLDEIHTGFNARNWQLTGDDVLYYNSQHRKFGDDIVAITQALGNVDKQFKSVAQEFVVIRNHGKEKLPILGGLFRSVGVFSTSSYLDIPMPGGGSLCQETKFFRLDVKGLAACYNTAAGVGVHSHSGGDKNQKASGLNPAWVFVLIVALAWFIWKVPDWAGSAVQGKVRKAHAVVVGTNSVSVPSVVTNASVGGPAVFGSSGGQMPGVLGGSNKSEAPKVEKPVRYLTGAFKLNGRWMVFLTDGTKLVSGVDPEFTRYYTEQKAAVIAGELVRWRPASMDVAPAPAVQARPSGPVLGMKGLF